MPIISMTGDSTVTVKFTEDEENGAEKLRDELVAKFSKPAAPKRTTTKKATRKKPD